MFTERHKTHTQNWITVRCMYHVYTMCARAAATYTVCVYCITVCRINNCIVPHRTLLFMRLILIISLARWNGKADLNVQYQRVHVCSELLEELCSHIQPQPTDMVEFCYPLSNSWFWALIATSVTKTACFLEGKCSHVLNTLPRRKD